MIFLIDDDPIQNMLTSQLIKMTDEAIAYKIFNNGAEAIEAIQELEKCDHPSLILLDINMPIMDGWEFLNIYDTFEETAPVFMLTSSLNNLDKNKSTVYSCVAGYYPKPVKIDDVKEILSKIQI